jgi:hypothetical protein
MVLKVFTGDKISQEKCEGGQEEEFKEDELRHDLRRYHRRSL